MGENEKDIIVGVLDTIATVYTGQKEADNMMKLENEG